jgi:hypothetical protein
MKRIKTVSFIVVLSMIFALLTSCSNVSYIATIENEKLPVGPYAFYAYYTRDNYQSNLSYYGVTDFTSALTEQADSSGVKLYDYIMKETKSSYIQHLITERKFEEYGLSLTDDQKAALDETFQKSWIDSNGIEKFTEICKTLELTSAEFKEMISVSYKNAQLMEHLFGEGGSYEITEEELRNKYADGYERFRYIAISKVDASGNMLTTDELIAKQALVDDAYQKALDGEDFGTLISEYSDDYLKITDDLTDEQKAAYEASNKQACEDGLVIDKNGIFNYEYYVYYNYVIDSNIVNAVFADTMANGDVKSIELSTAFWIIQKCDKNEKEDYFESKRSLIYNEIASPIIEELFTKWENELLITFNDAAVNKYDPRKISPLFITPTAAN